MTDWLVRTELLVKEEGIRKLQSANVLVVGLGGVGAAATEFIVRAGVGKMIIVDGDVIDTSNINRQLPALHNTVGKSKVSIVAQKLKNINPKLILTEIEEFIEPDRVESLLSEGFDYVVDCIDSITPKLHIIAEAKAREIPIISSMGAGGKMLASSVQVTDISKSYNCMMARTIRKRLKFFGIRKGVKVVFSNELPNAESLEMTDGSGYKKSFYGTISYMPSLFGLHMAETVIRDLLK
ncbi:tRNA A37 threonylcarbamoyladenosine dehydratase [Balneicella halophila]|uniref:tRNA A37 threonylcarbamoyladenosine dehydratase n=1 Tax=Balneicella halophila TaxID=1537566 RepID=A0A7L4UPR1_BALHA|nr:tRNA threonylcarbamoyladenosine dehydratase [Balneicella halophila]PVX51775.1 tRNA A37 threonylcarbamoyladenosine dehydratase [Balneicella halophila]